MTNIEQHGITAAKANAFGTPKGPAQLMGDGAFLAYMGKLLPTSAALSTAVQPSVSGIEDDVEITTEGLQSAAVKSNAEAESVPLAPDALSVIAPQPGEESLKPPASDESLGPAPEEQTAPLIAGLIPAPSSAGSAPYFAEAAQFSPDAGGIEALPTGHQRHEHIGRALLYKIPDISDTYTAALQSENPSISGSVSQPRHANFSSDGSSQTTRIAPVAQDSDKMAAAVSAALPNSALEATGHQAPPPISGQAWPMPDPMNPDRTALATPAQSQSNAPPPLKASANTDLPTAQSQNQNQNLPLQANDSRDASIIVRAIPHTGASSESSAHSSPARDAALKAAPQAAHTIADASALGTDNLEVDKGPLKTSPNQPMQNEGTAISHTPKAAETGHILANSPDTASTPAAQISKPHTGVEAVPYSDVLLASNGLASPSSTPHSTSVAQVALHQPVPIPALA